MIDKRTLDELLWICDFNGDELGYPEEEIVSIYSHKGLDIIVDSSKTKVLKIIMEEVD